METSLTVADLTPDLIRAELSARAWRLGRASELLRVLYLGKASAEELRVAFGAPGEWASLLALGPVEVLREHVAADGTRKLLVGMRDGHSVECVLMGSEKEGCVSACVSSQVGCAMACDFCASGIGGLTRNLSAAEITSQYLLLRNLARKLGKRLSTLVFMGMGEPMHNLENVVEAIHRIAGPDCAGLGYKNVQVSTVGIVPGIVRLTESGARVQLALSLHGPDDETRSSIVPAGRKYTVAATLDAAWAHQERTGRVSNIEYCLLAGVNDSLEHARKLAEALGGRLMHVNLIPHNPIGVGISGKEYGRPSKEALVGFLNELRRLKVVAHIRKTRGDDSSAACGQLRRVALAVV